MLDHAPDLIATYAAQGEADLDWHIPPLPAAAFGVNAADCARVDALLTPQPLNTYFERVRMQGLTPHVHKSYLRCTRFAAEVLSRSVARVQLAPDWRYAEIDAVHDVMLTEPAMLTRILLELQAAGKSGDS